MLLRRVRLPEGTPPDARQAIARAAAAAQSIEHKNILSVIHVLDAGAEIEIAYEYVEAEPLRVLQSSEYRESNAIWVGSASPRQRNPVKKMRPRQR